MTFHITCIDKPGYELVRKQTRAVHLEYMIANQKFILFGGPLRTDDGANTIGSVFALNFGSRTDVEEFLREEPYFNAGLFESVIVRRVAVMMPEATPGFLVQELARERARLQQII